MKKGQFAVFPKHGEPWAHGWDSHLRVIFVLLIGVLQASTAHILTSSCCQQSLWMDVRFTPEYFFNYSNKEDIIFVLL